MWIILWGPFHLYCYVISMWSSFFFVLNQKFPHLSDCFSQANPHKLFWKYFTMFLPSIRKGVRHNIFLSLLPQDALCLWSGAGIIQATKHNVFYLILLLQWRWTSQICSVKQNHPTYYKEWKSAEGHLQKGRKKSGWEAHSCFSFTPPPVPSYLLKTSWLRKLLTIM